MARVLAEIFLQIEVKQNGLIAYWMVIQQTQSRQGGRRMHGSTIPFDDHINQFVDRWNEGSSCPFAQLLPEEMIAEALHKCGHEFRDRVFSPSVTIWTFIGQCLSRDHSCRNALSQVLAQRVAQGEGPISLDASSYCQARKRLPLEFYQELLSQTAGQLTPLTREEWTIFGRRTLAIDGTTVTMPDTPANQAAFPQSTGQEPGLGFPIARVGMVCDLATGAVVDVKIIATKGKKTGETTIFRQMLSRSLRAGDVVIADREYDSYRNVAFAKALGVDVIFRMNGSRKADFRRGEKLGPKDHIVIWKKPKFDRNRFSRDEYEQLPDQIEMREIRIRVPDKHLRPKEITIVTTLLDSEKYPRIEIGDGMRRRWDIETDFNASKTHMQMSHLRTKGPETVRKEILTHLIAYNLVRLFVCHAAISEDLQPRQISHKGTIQIIGAYALRFPTLDEAVCRSLLQAVAAERVRNRPKRVEPRELKRRRSKYKHLTKPRSQRRQELMT